MYCHLHSCSSVCRDYDRARYSSGITIDQNHVPISIQSSAKAAYAPEASQSIVVYNEDGRASETGNANKISSVPFSEITNGRVLKQVGPESEWSFVNDNFTIDE